MAQNKGGKPDAWSDDLWAAYKEFGDWDHVYVKSCNRFLAALMTLYPIEHAELTVGLKQLLLDHDMEPHLEDQLDVYRAWYAKHIKWPKECFCEIDDGFVDSEGTPLMGYHDGTEEGVAPTQVRPWFLGATIQLAKHLAKGGYEGVPEPQQDYLTQLLAEARDSPEQRLSLEARLTRYMADSGWAVDQVWLEEAPDYWLPSGTRRPDQSIKEFINQMFHWLNWFMAHQIRDKGAARPHHRKELRGGAPEAEKKHEEMVARKMFGESISDIVVAMQDDLPPASTGDPSRAVNERVKNMAGYLGLIPSAGDKP
jgi:hypothetical protein